MPHQAPLRSTDGPPDYELRCPCVSDAVQLWQLVRDAPFLDANSCYTYLLLCSDFAETCVVACQDGRIGGFVTAYRPPRRADVIFVWQIGVAPEARRQGLGRRLLRHLVQLPSCREVAFLQATVTPANEASRRLFEAFAADVEAPVQEEVRFTSDDFGPAGHESEILLSIGPLPTRPSRGSMPTREA